MSVSEKKKVLVVDDEIHIIHIMRTKLENNDFKPITASSAMEALNLVAKEKPDIIISDVEMPTMTGIDLVKKLRQEEETKGIPVILLTARGFSLSPEQSESLKVNKTFCKPFSPRDVIGAVEDILYRKP